MAKIEIKIICIAGPAIFAAWIAGAIVRAGLPVFIARAVFASFAWVRIAPEGQSIFHGWAWIGDTLEIMPNG